MESSPSGFKSPLRHHNKNKGLAWKQVNPFCFKIREAFYGGIPAPITDKVYKILDKCLGKITIEFMKEFCEVR